MPYLAIFVKRAAQGTTSEGLLVDPCSTTSLEFGPAVDGVHVPELVDLAMWINVCVLNPLRES
jgi:hypothetical protein